MINGCSNELSLLKYIGMYTFIYAIKLYIYVYTVIIIVLNHIPSTNRTVPG